MSFCKNFIFSDLLAMAVLAESTSNDDDTEGYPFEPLVFLQPTPIFSATAFGTLLALFSFSV
jgi:hypothetical protein